MIYRIIIIFIIGIITITGCGKKKNRQPPPARASLIEKEGNFLWYSYYVDGAEQEVSYSLILDPKEQRFEHVKTVWINDVLLHYYFTNGLYQQVSFNGITYLKLKGNEINPINCNDPKHLVNKSQFLFIKWDGDRKPLNTVILGDDPTRGQTLNVSYKFSKKVGIYLVQAFTNPVDPNDTEDYQTHLTCFDK